MRERLDCALICTTCADAWAARWAGVHAGGKLHVQAGAPSIDINHPAACSHLVQCGMALRRFDVCLLAISEHNLAWARTSLSTARHSLATPVFALIRHLKAAALNDLYSLGLADFVRDPLCAEELRVRIERLLDGRRHPAARLPSTFTAGGLPAAAVAESPSRYGDAHPAHTEAELCANILERTGLELDAYAAAAASRCATTKESFRAAKSKIIERFETAYIRAALGRHSGNIAMAARAAQKHRRAFWALMRKYQIDAAPYRGETRLAAGMPARSQTAQEAYAECPGKPPPKQLSGG